MFLPKATDWTESACCRLTRQTLPRNKKTDGFVLFLVGFALPLRVSSIQRKTKREMNYNTATLQNGLRIIHLPSASPVVYCGYGVCAGTRDEGPGEEGMAHFCEHTTFKGTSSRSAMQILNRLESVGGDLNAFTNKEDTFFYSAILREHFPRAAELLSDIVFRSVYPQNEIAKEVEVICDEIESYNDSPSELIYDDFESAVFEGHPLGNNILGHADVLRTYTTDSAFSFVRRMYVPSNCVFFVYGNVEFKSIVRLLERYTEDIASVRLHAVEKPTVSLPPYGPKQIHHRRGTHQAHVMLGNRAFSAHDDRRIALFLLNNILGGPGMNARLNVSLRERNALVYTVESNVVSYTDTGLWSAYFGCDPGDVKRCLKLVRRELDRLMLRPLTESQLRAAKRQIKGQLCVASDNRENFALGFAKTYLHYGRLKDMQKLLSAIDNVTPQDLQQVAQEVFAADRLTILIYE